MGGADEWASAKQLLRKCAARCDGRRFARLVRDLLRHKRRPGIRILGCRRQLGSNRAGSSARLVGRGTGAEMIRVTLPYHLRTLARVEDEVTVDVQGEVTLRSVLDALETQYPMLRGTI